MENAPFQYRYRVDKQRPYKIVEYNALSQSVYEKEYTHIGNDEYRYYYDSLGRLSAKQVYYNNVLHFYDVYEYIYPRLVKIHSNNKTCCYGNEPLPYDYVLNHLDAIGRDSIVYYITDRDVAKGYKKREMDRKLAMVVSVKSKYVGNSKRLSMKCISKEYFDYELPLDTLMGRVKFEKCDCTYYRYK
jgi:YD repeat-containing protein